MELECTWESTPSHKETSEPDFPWANRSKINRTDLSIGKTEPSPAFSRLQIYTVKVESQKGKRKDPLVLANIINNRHTFTSDSNRVYKVHKAHFSTIQRSQAERS
jgi:hypothetical protein